MLVVFQVDLLLQDFTVPVGVAATDAVLAVAVAGAELLPLGGMAVEG